MCIGLPMRIVLGGEFTAACERRGETQAVSLALVGPQQVGTHVLVHLGAAVRVLGAEEAQRIDDALDGVAAALQGRAFDHLFADLIDREPQLPDFLAAGRGGHSSGK
ncbi:HypC/HybG/HupF family hydrogenase formation chaperone [Blastochloris sulfoviridis]|uniref:HypC/HybG/HupF family hydrogenase formation chaperone n=1 Tax=Blastochloris sulfoviridis TaxID=50712 RepID=A0A5M6I0V2_9HYPH|nr:HypC/HybG/HupF family hydrogenase formation chaperone [Blastochloris sulfoviridis]KAA5601803.1 HypC/HybG/HupF family hydrogenase formation chaperone [Blastochloris sulfoviridis]